MLTLQRKSGDIVYITVPPSNEERQIAVRVSRMAGSQSVKLGFDADEDVNIVRKEVLDRLDSKGG